MAIPVILDALADETRRQILFKLKEGKISSGDLATALGMTPQALSYHLSKLKKADFDLEDFLSQMRQIKKMGSLGGIMKMLPGLSGISVGEREERKMRQTEAIILSMTPAERRNPGIINARRRLRIASGSGTQVRDVNALLKQFEGMRKMMKMMRGDKGRRRMSQMMSSMKNRFPGA